MIKVRKIDFRLKIGRFFVSPFVVTELVEVEEDKGGGYFIFKPNKNRNINQFLNKLLYLI